jgi:hypothetical protein
MTDGLTNQPINWLTEWLADLLTDKLEQSMGSQVSLPTTTTQQHALCLAFHFTGFVGWVAHSWNPTQRVRPA